MKKLFLSILIIICLSFQASAWNPMVVTGGKKSAAGPDYSDITFWSRLESTTLDGANDYSAGDTTLAATSEVEIAAGGKTNNGIHLIDGGGDGGDYYTLVAAGDDDIANGTNCVFYMWFNYSTQSNGSRFFKLYKDTNNFMVVYIIAGAEIRIQWRQAGDYSYVDSTDVNLSSSTDYLLIVTINSTTPIRSIHLYNASTGAEVGSGADNTDAFDGWVWSTGGTLDIGNSAATATAGYIDDFRISNDSTRNFLLLKDTDNYP